MVALSFNASDHPPPPGYISLTFGRYRNEYRWTDKRLLTFEQLANLLSHATVGEKDGPCYTPATFSGTARKQDQATRIDIAVLDADCGHSFEEIRKAVSEKGWCAIIHSTHSHETDKTTIAADACDKWMAEQGVSDVSAYMLSKKGYLPHILVGAQIVNEIRNSNTREYVVKHQPCPKFRIILMLQEPWIAAEFPNQTEANKAWKERTLALAHALGLHHDQSCVDTSRLYYLPRHKAGAPFVHTVINGEDCPLWTLPDPAKAPPAAAPLFDAPQHKPQLVQPDHLTFSGPDGQQINLTAWAARYAGRFEITKALRARSPHQMASRVNGVKQHICCPHADSHFTGGNDKTGTFVVNSSQIGQAELGSLQSGFAIHCSHNGCAGRDRLSFLQKMLADKWLSITDLTNPEFLTPEAPLVDFSALVDPSKSGERKGNIAPHLYAHLPGVMKEIHGWMVATSPKPQPALCLGATLSFMAAAVGRKVQLQHWGTRPNVYILGVAHSGAGKERPLSACKQMAKSAGLFEKLIGVEEVASDAGIISAVLKQPSQVMLLDEVSFLISAANNQRSGSHLVNVISTLLKLYSSSHTTFKSKSYADLDKVSYVDQPCVSLYGCSTPKGLFSALTSKDITNGLLSRGVLFDAGDNDPRGQPPSQAPVPANIVDWLRSWDQVPLNPNPLAMDGGAPVLEPITVLMTQEAMDLSEAFEDEMHALKIKARERGMDALYVRARENALKFALIRACAPPAVWSNAAAFIDRSNLKVDAECMRWAIELSRATVLAMEQAAKDGIVDSQFELRVKNFRDMIKNAGTKGVTFREMGRQSAGRLPQRERDDIIRLLSEAKDIFFVDNVNEGKTRGGVKRQAFVYKKFIKDADED
jgi:hypothetical protein